MKIGIDEVGRGCIAGDLVVVAYAFKDSQSAEGKAARDLCADSKAFKSRKAREEAFKVIEPAGRWYLARRSPQDIDKVNIRMATLSAMEEAALAVAQGHEGVECLFDGRDIPPGFPLPCQAIIKGDAKVVEIGAASILAKVIRDKEMEEAGDLYPGYGFQAHAGYGTKAHCEAIARLGLSPIHRSWARKFLSSS